MFKLRQDKFMSGQHAPKAEDQEEITPQMVDLLQRNHDTMFEKYELYR